MEYKGKQPVTTCSLWARAVKTMAPAGLKIKKRCVKAYPKGRGPPDRLKT
jgi:hypothetical protein